MDEQHGVATPGYAVSVDLGTSNTVAVLRWPDGRTRVLLFDGAPLMPSGVFAAPDGRLVVGRDAARMAAADPGRFEPNPKRRVDEPAVLLGEREVPTADLLAALLTAVAAAAVEAVGFLPPAVLTFPAAWGPQRRGVLVAAAQRAGWPPPLLVPEPVAAARYFVEVLRRPVPVGGALAVFDFGGGTVDVAVVRNDGWQDGVSRFAVLGSGGVETLGGLDIDAALVHHLGAAVAGRSPLLWRAIADPGTTAQRRDRRLFWDDVRGAKEMLSRAAAAPVAVPGHEEALHVTREELERVAHPLLARAVAEATDVIRRCGLRDGQLVGLFLVGGSSRLPAVARLLHVATGIAPTVLEQPELPVAEGALTELRLPHPAAPVAGVAPAGVAPVSAQPVSAQPVSAQPVSAQPVSAQPVGARPVGVPAGGGRRRWYRRPVTWIAAGVAVAVVAAGTAAVLLARGTGGVEFESSLVAGARLPIPKSADLSTQLTAVRGNRAYVVLAGKDGVQAGAFDLTHNRVLWGLRSVPVTGGDWVGLDAVAGGVVLRADPSLDVPGQLVVLDPANGAVRWTREVQRDDTVTYTSDALVISFDDNHATYGFNWRNFKQPWSQPYPSTSSGSFESVSTLAPSAADDLTAPAAFGAATPTVELGGGRSLLQLTSGKRLIVRDPADGRKVREFSGVGAGYGTVVAAHDRWLFVASGEEYKVERYDVTRSGVPTTVYQADDGHTVEQLVPCGDELLCVLERSQSSEWLVLVDLATKRAKWRKEVKSAEQVVPVGGEIFVRAPSPGNSWLFDLHGGQHLTEDDAHSAGGRAGAASMLLFGGGSVGSSPDEWSITGLGVPDHARRPLGSQKLVGNSCTWSSTHLVCSTGTEFRTWRFAS